jgi:hypothetical protein
MQHTRSARAVLVVSRNTETLDGLQEYLSRTGIASSTRGSVNPLAEMPESVRALVVFPDDFAAHEVNTYLSIVQARRPELSLVIVSREPATYSAMRGMNGHPLNATVLPRPAFGWTIVDAIRATSTGPSLD